MRIYIIEATENGRDTWFPVRVYLFRSSALRWLSKKSFFYGKYEFRLSDNYFRLHL